LLQNPDTALFLFVAIVLIGFMFGKRWQGVRDAITAAGKAAQTKATTP
jgi:hypothetical protein